MYYDPGINVVVCNYKTSWDLQTFCQSLFVDNTGNFDLTIANVDPGPADDDAAKDWLGKKPGVTRSIFYKENVGYATAVNDAVSLGRREVIAIFNADVKLLSGCLQQCYQALMDHPGWGVAGPLQYDNEGQVTHAGIFGTNDKPVHRDWRVPVAPHHRENRPAITVSGSAYFIKREAWDQLTACPLYQEVTGGVVGAFLPTKLYYEETWASYHARAHGWEIMYFGEAECIHNWHQAVVQNQMHNYSNRCFATSKIEFRRACDHHGIPHD